MLKTENNLLEQEPSKLESHDVKSVVAQQKIAATLQTPTLTPNEYFKDLGRCFADSRKIKREMNKICSVKG